MKELFGAGESSRWPPSSRSAIPRSEHGGSGAHAFRSSRRSTASKVGLHRRTVSVHDGAGALVAGIGVAVGAGGVQLVAGLGARGCGCRAGHWAGIRLRSTMRSEAAWRAAHVAAAPRLYVGAAGRASVFALGAILFAVVNLPETAYGFVIVAAAVLIVGLDRSAYLRRRVPARAAPRRRGRRGDGTATRTTRARAGRDRSVFGVETPAPGVRDDAADRPSREMRARDACAGLRVGVEEGLARRAGDEPVEVGDLGPFGVRHLRGMMDEVAGDHHQLVAGRDLERDVPGVCPGVGTSWRPWPRSASISTRSARPAATTGATESS